MSRASAAQTLLSFGDQPEETGPWDDVLTEAFADPDRTSGFLDDAELAVRAQPGDAAILMLAATAALLDRNPERAQVDLLRADPDRFWQEKSPDCFDRARPPERTCGAARRPQFRPRDR